MTRALITQMLEALDMVTVETFHKRQESAITAAREWLAAPEQSEPVAWRKLEANGKTWALFHQNVGWKDTTGFEPLYTHPAPQPKAEPVAWRVWRGAYELYFNHYSAVQRGRCFLPMRTPEPLYTHPAPQPTTPEPVNQMLLEALKLIASCESRVKGDVVDVARAAIAAAAQAPQPTYGWLIACDDAMITTHLGVAELSHSYEYAKKRLNELIDWHIAVAVNGGLSLQPQPAELTDEEIDDIWVEHGIDECSAHVFARAVLAAQKGKE